MGNTGEPNPLFSSILLRKNHFSSKPPVSRFVTVEGRQMHLADYGKGEKTIVFMSGLGTACPSIDYLPLINHLKQDYRCVVAELFGYGYSDDTLRPRTLQNLVEETRQALLQAGIAPPYVLLGHSIAGIYMLYWASHYPDEVEAVIGNDSSVPGQSTQVKASPFTPLLNRLGLFHLLFRLGWREKKLLCMCGRDPLNLPDVRKLAGNNYICWSLYDEGKRLLSNITATRELKFPENCSLLHLVSKQSSDMIAKKGFDWTGEHEKQVRQVKSGRLVLLNGGHYLHWTHSSEMASEIKAFLKEEPQDGFVLSPA